MQSDSTNQAHPAAHNVGVVVIGRNEGERLVRCLDSLLAQDPMLIVYVDSGSTDGSVAMAQAKGVHVVDLDRDVPFTMARGRNAGFRRLLEIAPDTEWIQFVDGDCEVHSGWMAEGLRFLKERSDVVAVCGFRRERFPHATLYNRLVDIEWRGPTGDIDACGGDALYRARAFKESGGFNESMIAGEEGELCARLRRNGGKIWRLDRPMTLHDAALQRFGQWWRRSVRAGHAYAEAFSLQRTPSQRKRLVSTLLYGFGVPGLAAAGALAGALPVAIPLKPWLLAAGLGLCCKSGVGAFRGRRRLGDERADAALYAAFCVLGKLPEAQGVARYAISTALGRRSALIEYKRPSPGGNSPGGN